tara:strand:- start:573 stop:710 length:138 start_codon:yes stop_codon:yes gene_type:complete
MNNFERPQIKKESQESLSMEERIAMAKKKLMAPNIEKIERTKKFD